MSNSNSPGAKRPMGRLKIIGLSVVGLAVLSVLLALIAGPERKPPSPKLSVDEQYSIEAAALTSAAHQIMLTRLRDPASAIFNYDLPGYLHYFCGTVKARNAFGGYGDNVYYMMFPSDIVTSDDIGSSRFTRIWNKLCLGELPHTKDYQSLPNRPSALIDELSSADRAWMLGRWVGDGCQGTRAFFMGIGKAGISKNIAFWSVACRSRHAYELAISPDGKGRILECSELKALHAGSCFKKLEN